MNPILSSIRQFVANLSTKDCSDYPLFLPIKFYHHSLIILIAVIAHNIWAALSLYSWGRFFLTKSKLWYNWIGELWLLILFVFLYYGIQLSSYPSILAIVISLYVLFDVVGATLRDFVISPLCHVDTDGPFICIHNPSRWMLTSFISLIFVILAFAILFRNYGAQFEPNIDGAITAIYISAMTFTTLGYGDIVPNQHCDTGKLLVCCELFFFLFFLAIKLPVAVSVIRTKTSDKHKYFQSSKPPCE